jgi:S1-C subfamily serine protease
VVSFSDTLQVRKDGDFEKHEVRLLFVNHEVDIALFTVVADDFWAGAVELPLGSTPRLQQRVDVVGFPMGGNGISITTGIVSRLDWGSYAHGGCENLLVTVDAAINGGNSGGPAISNGKVVGVAFQSLLDADNIGFIVPCEVLCTVLRDFDEAVAASPPGSGPCEPLIPRGFARFDPNTQCCENKEIRRAAGLPDGTSGVLIREVPLLSNLNGVLLKGDVIVALDGEPVSNDGRIKHGTGSPMDFRVKVTLKLVGEPLMLSVMRGGERFDIAALAELAPQIVPKRWFGPAAYVVFAGMVFVPMHSQKGADGLLEFPYNSWTAGLHKHAGRKHVNAKQQVCSLAAILPHTLMLGYDFSFFQHEPLLKVDGVDVLCLADILRATTQARGPWITFEFGDSKQVVLLLEDARVATTELMSKHGIAQAASDGVAAQAASAVDAKEPRTTIPEVKVAAGKEKGAGRTRSLRSGTTQKRARVTTGS